MSSTVSFEKINNKSVFQIFSQPDQPTKKIVIMSHGFRGSSVGPARSFVSFEKLLLQANMAVLRFDQPGCGNSQGNFLDSSFNEWINTTSYFAHKYLDLGYQVALFGQSMGATNTMVVAGQEDLKNKIPCIILWVPDAKSGVNVQADRIYEEDGQKYRGQFWLEAKQADFFAALDKYPGKIHLVYGEKDRYVPLELREKTVEKIKAKNQPYMILPGQDHSPWEEKIAAVVFEQELKFLQNNF